MPSLVCRIYRTPDGPAGAPRAAHGRAGWLPGVHERDVGLCLEVDRFRFVMVARHEGRRLVLPCGHGR